MGPVQRSGGKPLRAHTHPGFGQKVAQRGFGGVGFLFSADPSRGISHGFFGVCFIRDVGERESCVFFSPSEKSFFCPSWQKQDFFFKSLDLGVLLFLIFFSPQKPLFGGKN